MEFMKVSKLKISSGVYYMQVGKLSRKLERHDAEIAELRSKIIWTHAELPATGDQSSTTVPQTPLPGTLPIDVR